MQFLQLVAPLIPTVIKTVERLIPGPKKGAKKRARAIKTIEALAAAVPAIAVQAAGVKRELGKQIDAEVSRMNAANELARLAPPL